MSKSWIFLLAILMLGSLNCCGQSDDAPLNEEEKQEDIHETVRGTLDLVYKQIGSVDLDLRVMYPDNFSEDETAPCIVFFHGGGWRNGKKEAFERQANYFTSRGLVCFLVEYRIESEHGTTPFEALKDAKSSLRYIKTHAEALGVDPQQIIASGGSAGGHLAVSSALIEEINEEGEDRNVSAVPNALVLFNPVLDTSKRGFGYQRVGGEEHYREISPILHIDEQAPPTLIMVGTEDKVLPQYIAEEYRDAMINAGRRCDLILYPDEEHGFFNYKNGNPYFFKTLEEADKFLNSLGYLEGEPTVDEYFNR